jgi:hypothetical protein
MNYDKVHYYSGRCDKAVGKLLKVVQEVQTRQEKLEEEFHKMQQAIEKKELCKTGVVGRSSTENWQRKGRSQEKFNDRIFGCGEGEEEIHRLESQ